MCICDVCICGMCVHMYKVWEYVPLYLRLFYFRVLLFTSACLLVLVETDHGLNPFSISQHVQQ